MVCLIEPTSIMSRIATGLITGSFVGAINIFVNYAHARSSFFDKLARALLDICHQLGFDYISAKLENERLASSSKKENIAFYKNRFEVERKAVDEMKAKYDNLLAAVNIDEFACLIPTDYKLSSVLDELDDLTHDFMFLYGEYQMGHVFSMLSVKTSKQERMLVIGDPDEFYDDLIKQNKDYEDLLAYDLDRLGDYSANLGKAMSGIASSNVRRLLSDIKCISAHYLENAEIRDVQEDRARELGITAELEDE